LGPRGRGLEAVKVWKLKVSGKWRKKSQSALEEDDRSVAIRHLGHRDGAAERLVGDMM
jgi:hypothetical protein